MVTFFCLITAACMSVPSRWVQTKARLDLVLRFTLSRVRSASLTGDDGEHHFSSAGGFPTFFHKGASRSNDLIRRVFALQNCTRIGVRAFISIWALSDFSKAPTPRLAGRIFYEERHVLWQESLRALPNIPPADHKLY